MAGASCSVCGGPLHDTQGGSTVCARCAFGWALETRTVEEPEPESVEQQRVGPFRLIRVLGEGGMGVVWEALQEQPVRRRVALKWIRPGMDTATVLARFETERQALARMSSSHIAQVFDAGRSEDGRPWFAMEYVEGAWITEYCDASRMPIHERLRLFVEVCRGVQHAHHKGVIHRDIKPSNVLVSGDGAKAVPKIIDFGLAKALGDPITGRSMVTRLGQLVGTPAYMSPEQGGAGFDVDTRADVYSLGVLLFELLTGHIPFDASEQAIEELRRRIREEDAPTPSARVTALSPDVAERAAERRGTNRAGLVRALRGDLDWVVARALARDRSRRYGTPDELAAELLRHLANEPVLAGPPSVGYRTRKLLRRHTAAVTAGSAIALLLVVTAVGMTIQAGRIARERDRANREAETARAALGFLTDTFRLSDPEQARGETITAREILDRAAAELGREAHGSPEVEAAMTFAIGRTYANLGLYERADPLLRRAVELHAGIFGTDAAATDESRFELAWVLRRREMLDEAEELARSLAEGETALAGRAWSVVGMVLSDRGDFEQAEVALRTAAEVLTRANGPLHEDVLEVSQERAEALTILGRFDEADALFGQVLEAQRRTLGDNHPDLVATLNGMAINHRRAGRHEEAEAQLRQAVAISESVLGPEHPDTLTARQNLGLLMTQQGRFEEAEPLLRAVLDGRMRILGPGAVSTLTSLMEWGMLELSRKNYAEAEGAFRDGLAGYERAFGPDHPETLRAMNNLALTLRATGRLAEAESMLRPCFEGAKKAFGPTHPQTLTVLANLGELVEQQGRPEEGLGLVEEALAGLRAAFPDGHLLVGQTLIKQGSCLTALGRFDEAERALVEAREMVVAHVGADHSVTRLADEKLTALRAAAGRSRADDDR
jgi:non-specific serine/threonine protein kinase/serine/threonine-protein kinase